ncbi:stage III sporulation protein AD [Alteribacillus sp. HJP-4]
MQVVGFALVATFLILIIKDQNPAIAMLIVLSVGAVIFIVLLSPLQSAIELMQKLSDRAGIEHVYIQTLLKIIGVAYIAEFGAQIAKDAGQQAIASKIELAGKLFIIMLAIPIFEVLIETILQLVPGQAL